MSYQFSDSLKSVKTCKVSELIVQQIKSAILSGLVGQGDRLPSERELCQRFGASRNSVREAIRILELSGLLQVKRGSGVFVGGDNSRPIRDSLDTMLKMKTITLTELTEARIVTEPGVAALACRNATAEDMERLEANIRDAKEIVKTDGSAFAVNIDFHHHLAETTHNTVIIAMADTLFGMLKQASLEIISRSTNVFAGSTSAIRFHESILKAFHKKDSELAQRLMVEHVAQIQTALGKNLEIIDSGSKEPDERNSSS